jgi:hypothetical protein
MKSYNYNFYLYYYNFDDKKQGIFFQILCFLLEEGST